MRLNFCLVFCFKHQLIFVSGESPSGRQFYLVFHRALPWLPCCALYIYYVVNDIESDIRLPANGYVYNLEIGSIKDTAKFWNGIVLLGKWTRQWGMRLEPIKCSLIYLTRKRINKISANDSLERKVLESVGGIEHLCVTITKNLKWITDKSNICTHKTAHLASRGVTSLHTSDGLRK